MCKDQTIAKSFDPFCIRGLSFEQRSSIVMKQFNMAELLMSSGCNCRDLKVTLGRGLTGSWWIDVEFGTSDADNLWDGRIEKGNSVVPQTTEPARILC